MLRGSLHPGQVDFEGQLLWESRRGGYRALGRWPEPRLGGRAQQQQEGLSRPAVSRGFLWLLPSSLASQASLSSRSRVFSSLRKGRS